VPGDPSSAAMWVVLASVHPDAELTVRGVCLNPGRTGFLSVLGQMGARIEISGRREVGGEEVGDLHVTSSALRGTEVTAEEVAALVDEVPVLAVAAAMATGDTWFRGLAELRYKEVDRVAAIADQLGRLGAEVEVEGDDILVHGGGRLTGAEVDAKGDHRLAMSLAVAASVADGPTTINGAEAAGISYPAFFGELRAISEPG
jgi:3-phosphoshikimate 1-carboxyvinyltransferase